MREVSTPAEAVEALGLPGSRCVTELSGRQMTAFRKLVGWDHGGPVVKYPTAAEQEARKRREKWKRERAGNTVKEPCLWVTPEQVRTLKRNVAKDARTARWFKTFMTLAEQVADLPLSAWTSLVPDQGPWVAAGSFCPHCVGRQSPVSIGSPFWRWSALDPEHLECPYCGISYPNEKYPENEILALPRLGLSYCFHVTGRERGTGDWRSGAHASRFAGAPTHVSFSGEIRLCKLMWVVGQVEPLGLAYAVTGQRRYADVVAAILNRLAAVYHRYPLATYIQEYADADPAYVAEHLFDLPTSFKRGAFLLSYTGQVGKQTGLWGMSGTTPLRTRLTNGEWGASRVGWEKGANGMVFLSLLKGYDLIKQALSCQARLRIERDFLLELYQDVKALSRKINNKSGPGAASRAAVGVLYEDEAEMAEAIEQFKQVMRHEFHADGSCKETPIYSAKPLMERLAEIPELLRGRQDFYDDPLYRNACRFLVDIATPLGTLPCLGDSFPGFSMRGDMAAAARLRLGLSLPDPVRDMRPFNMVRTHLGAQGLDGFMPRLDKIALTRGEGREEPDGPIGFPAAHQPHRSSVHRRCVFSMLNEHIASVRPRRHVPLNRYYHGRGLVCLGFGTGRKATQLYCNADDGLGGHRHGDALSILLFAGGREVFPDLGYICDHPANGWVKHTAAHNTVMLDRRLTRAVDHGVLDGLITSGPFRFCDVRVPVSADRHPRRNRTAMLRRAMLMFPKPDGLPVLVDVFDVDGGGVHDYLVRVNDPDQNFHIEGPDLKHRPRGLVRDAALTIRPWGHRTAGGRRRPWRVTWGASFKVTGSVLTPCDEVVTFKSPAWRTAQEVFLEPERSWDTLALETRGPAGRTVVVYEPHRGARSLKDLRAHARGTEVQVTMKVAGRAVSALIGKGSCRVSGL